VCVRCCPCLHYCKDLQCAPASILRRVRSSPPPPLLLCKYLRLLGRSSLINLSSAALAGRVAVAAACRCSVLRVLLLPPRPPLTGAHLTAPAIFLQPQLPPTPVPPCSPLSSAVPFRSPQRNPSLHSSPLPRFASSSTSGVYLEDSAPCRTWHT
jgi:hypothetical protein